MKLIWRKVFELLKSLRRFEWVTASNLRGPAFGVGRLTRLHRLCRLFRAIAVTQTWSILLEGWKLEPLLLLFIHHCVHW